MCYNHHVEGGLMYLKKSTLKKTGRTHLSICHSYNLNGKSKTKTIQTLGYVDVLKEEYDDPIAHFTKVVAQMEAKRKAQISALNITIYPQQRIDKDKTNRKNLGFCVLSKIYHELQIDSFLANRQTKRKLGYSLSSVMKLLVYSRILNPGSKLHDFNCKDSYFERFDFSDDDVYRALGIFAKYKDELLAYLHMRTKTLYGRNTETVFYDVTNTYFEIDKPDDLRKKGVSKEHRPDPIVAMGLLLDKDALPVTYKLYPGNTVDCDTLIPQLKEIKKTYDTGRIIVVADKGLCTSDNILACLGKGDGYVISKSVRKGTDELKKWVLDEQEYVFKSDDYKSKSRIFEDTLNVENENGKRTKKVKVTHKQVAFYSEKYAKKAKCERKAALEKARLIVANPAKLERMLDRSAAKYVKGIQYDKESGEVIETSKQLYFDEEKLAKEEALDGYYVIITSEVKRTDSDIIDMYRGLWEIEESFKLIKSCFGLRPVYVRNESSIEAHFLVCFIALLIMRLLDRRLGYKFPIPQIIKDLKNASASHLEDNWWLFDYRQGSINDIYDILGIDLRRKFMRSTEIRSLVAATKEHTDSPSKVRLETDSVLIDDNAEDGAFG
jgi:transposase